MHATGADRRWVRRHELAGTTILAYHGVLDAENERWVDPRYSMTVQQFKAQMDFLAARRNVIGLSELAEMVREGRTAPAGSVVITFDDGYRCLIRSAAPILKAHGLPATAFVPTGLIERAESLWIDQLFAMFNTRRSHKVRLNGSIGQEFAFDSRSAMRKAYASISALLLRADPSSRDALLDQIAAQLSPTEQPPRIQMDWSECARWLETSDKFEIGAHTREHLDLSSCAEDRVRGEIEGSVADVERQLGIRSPHFSYPYGLGTATARACVERAGCQSALSTEPMTRVVGGSDLFGLSRVGAPDSVRELGFMTSGAYPEMSQNLLGRA